MFVQSSAALLLLAAVALKAQVIQLNKGKIEGLEITSPVTNKTYWAFLGIRYAEPPTGELRFHNPVRTTERWPGVFKAQKEGPICPQRDFTTGEVIGEEDCLFLNVYIPKLPGGQLLPVMVWIHGGFFLVGSGSRENFGPDFLMSKENVVLVTMNYRLGALGFANLPEFEIKGNMGLKDQATALLWIQFNIDRFGGDSRRRTLFGQGAGAASAHLLTLYRRGIASRAILHSGSALAPWAFSHDVNKHSWDLATSLGCDEDEDELLECMQRVPVRAIVEMMPLTQFPSKWTPTVEHRYYQEIIGEEPIKKMRSGGSGRLTMIAGITSGEGLIMMNANRENISMEDFVPHCVKAKKGSPKSLEVAKVIEKFYLSDSSQIDAAYYNLTGAAMFVWPLAETLLNLPKDTSPPYIYLFEYEGALNIAKRTLKDQRFPGACHGDDLGYLFKTPTHPENIDQNALDVINKLVNMWTNFAVTGTPVKEEYWQGYSSRNHFYYRINGTLHLERDFIPEEVRFWKDLCEKYAGSS